MHTHIRARKARNVNQGLGNVACFSTAATRDMTPTPPRRPCCLLRRHKKAETKGANAAGRLSLGACSE